MCGPAQRESKAFRGFAARSEIRRVSAPPRALTNVGPYQEQKNASPEGWVRILSRDYAISFGSVEVNCREDDHFKINAMTESRSSLQTLADLFAVGTLIAKRPRGHWRRSSTPAADHFGACDRFLHTRSREM